MGIYYLFRSLGLEVYITSAAKSVWDYVFSETTPTGSVVDPDTKVNIKLYDKVANLTAEKKYPDLAELVLSNSLAAEYLTDQLFSTDRELSVVSNNAIHAVIFLKINYPAAKKILDLAEQHHNRSFIPTFLVQKQIFFK